MLLACIATCPIGSPAIGVCLTSAYHALACLIITLFPQFMNKNCIFLRTMQDF